MNKLVTTAAATTIFAAFAGNAFAYSDTPSAVVKFDRTEVATAGGAEHLYDRIHSAAWRVCSDMFPGNNGPSALDGLRCIRTLTDDAVKQVDNPRLTEVYEQREGYVPPS